MLTSSNKGLLTSIINAPSLFFSGIATSPFSSSSEAADAAAALGFFSTFFSFFGFLDFGYQNKNNLKIHILGDYIMELLTSKVLIAKLLKKVK